MYGGGNNVHGQQLSPTNQMQSDIINLAHYLF
jgi:hypothetical protein